MDLKNLYKYLPESYKNIVMLLLLARSRTQDTERSFFFDLPDELFFFILDKTLPITFMESGVINSLTSQTSNPANDGKVKCYASSVASGDPSNLCERGGGSGYTEPIPNSWVAIDFSPSRLMINPTSYSYTTRMWGGTPRALRNWQFQGSVDGVHWFIISNHINDKTIKDINGEKGTFNVDTKGRFFSCFRIIQTGPNAYRDYQENYAQLNFGNMEIFGYVIDRKITL
eukprot:TRINITY_DN1325_c0_g1_i4.p1 TRINITY_DN1325_c0_g1~~TRINITY_DN1325_c0_g1_i4.p1  ORF type:complete len:228 (-),score=30.96 TRINITY_DN1325_c0_g1_i4:145-828(-)